jgi:thymidylate kinase
MYKPGSATVLFDIEAIDGGGGQTQKDKLRDYLKSQKMNPSVYDYPRYERPIGKFLRDFLDGKVNFTPEQQLYLYAADMSMDNFEIEGSKSPVVRNRGPNSTVAYQHSAGYPYSQAVDMLKKIQLQADIVFYVDVDPREGQKRKLKDNEAPDKFEADMDFLKNVRGTYERLCREAPLGKFYKKIDGMQSIEKVHEEIKFEVHELLNRL